MSDTVFPIQNAHHASAHGGYRSFRPTNDKLGPARKHKVVVAGMIGNVLEWYDFAIYGYFAAAIGRQFFPHQDPLAQIVAAFGVFAVGYLMRPVGGALVGHIGDRFGRRAALTFSVAAMAIPTFLIGLLPGYATIGLAAPIALTLLRMVQGLSVGGEYTSSAVFLIEHAPEGRRGLFGALACAGATAASCSARPWAQRSQQSCRSRSSMPGAGASRSCSGSWWESSATFCAGMCRKVRRRNVPRVARSSRRCPIIGGSYLPSPICRCSPPPASPSHSFI